MTDSESDNATRNQGENNREATRRYNDSASEFTGSAAGKRVRAEKQHLDGAKPSARAQAAPASKDPQVTRDYIKAQG